MTEPGWYNDEQDPAVARWHDGTGWTEHTMAKADWPGPGSPPPPAALRTPAGPPLGAPLGAPLGRPPAPSGEPAGDDGPAALAAPPRPRRERPSPHLLGAIAALVVVAVCLVVLQRLHDDTAAKAGAPTTTSTLPSKSWEWTSDAAGTTYKITVSADPDPIDEASPHGCVSPPEEGRTNLGFRVTIENPSITQTVDVPPVSFGLNVDGDGVVDPSITSFEHAATAVEMSPLEAGASCSAARSIQAGSGQALPPGGSTTFTGVIGGAPASRAEGLALVVRVFQHDPNPRANPLVPFDTLVPFPVRGGGRS